MAAPISIADARELVLRSAATLAQGRPTRRVPVAQALDCVLAEDLRAAGDVPPFDCSAMDGFAVLAGPAGRRLDVIAESRAGHPAPAAIEEAGQAIRISTGAAIPAGATAVLRQEDAELEAAGAALLSTAAVAAGENVRYAGEDLELGDLVLPAGTMLGVAELGAAVAAGAAELKVSAPPRVQILCTGDELRAPGEPLGPGEIHNSNAVTLGALAGRSGAQLTGSARVRDDAAATRAALARALQSAEVLVISGGVSVGPHDHVKSSLAELGATEVFWRVSLRPGGPVWFGTAGETLVFGLPGNPVSAVVTFVLFVVPAIAALMGAAPRAERATARLTQSVARHPSRELAVRVALGMQAAGVTATPTGPQGSHISTSLLGADALALVAPGAGAAERGSEVELVPLPR